MAKSEVYTLPAFPGVERLGARALWELARRAELAGIDAGGLLGQIYLESGFRADAKAPNSSASGLIQMIDQSARRFAGVSAARLRKMSALQQIPGVVAYFSGLGPLKGSDFRLMGYTRDPSLLRAPPERVVYPPGSPAALANPQVQDESGAITVGTIRKQWDDKIPSVRMITVAKPPPAQSGGFGLVVAGVALFLWGLSRG